MERNTVERAINCLLYTSPSPRDIRHPRPPFGGLLQSVLWHQSVRCNISPGQFGFASVSFWSTLMYADGEIWVVCIWVCVCVCACVRVFYDFELLRCYVRFNIWLCVNVWEWTIALIFHWVEYSIMFPSAGFVWWLYQYLRNKISFSLQSPWAHLHVVGTLRFMSDINQPSLPTPFNSVLVSLSLWPFQLYFIP